jgi:hypothetical protein
MKDSIIQTKVSSVKVGHLTFEGLMDEGETFYIAQQQLAFIFQVIPTSAPKWLKLHLGRDCSLFSVKTNREEVEGKRVRSTEKAITLRDFERLLRKLDKSGNPIAESICDDLVGLSLTQLFSDAFKVKFEEEQRQEFLKTRQEGKQVRVSLTDAIKWHLEGNEVSDSKRHWIYINCSEAVNIGLFGRKASKMCIDFKVSDRSKLRDHLTADELRWLSEIEDLAARLIIYQSFEPVDAVKEAISRVAIPVVTRTA